MTIIRAFVQTRARCRETPMGQSKPAMCWKRHWHLTCAQEHCPEVERWVNDIRDMERDEELTK